MLLQVAQAQRRVGDDFIEMLHQYGLGENRQIAQRSSLQTGMKPTVEGRVLVCMCTQTGQFSCLTLDET